MLPTLSADSELSVVEEPSSVGASSWVVSSSFVLLDGSVLLVEVAVEVGVEGVEVAVGLEGVEVPVVVGVLVAIGLVDEDVPELTIPLEFVVFVVLGVVVDTTTFGTFC